MWGRKKEPGPPVVEIPNLDDEIRRLRDVIARGGARQAVGPLISVLSAKATLASMADRHDDVLDDRRTAAGLLRAFDGQSSPVDRHTTQLVWMGLTAAERRTGTLDAAMEAADRAVRLTVDLVPEDAEFCQAFLVDLDRLRADLRGAGRDQDALRVAELASDLATRLVELDEARFAALLGVTLVNEASTRASNGDLEAAAAVNEEAIRLLHDHPNQPRALTIALANRATWERRSGQWAEAVLSERDALDSVRAGTGDPVAELDRMNKLFITLRRAGRREEAEQTITEAIALARVLVESDPGQASVLATLLGNQANVRGELHRYQDALSSSEEALTLRERLAEADPSRDAYVGLGMVLNNHAAVLRRLGRLPEAAVTAARSVEVRRRVVEDDNPGSVALLANALNTHAEMLGRLGDAEPAVALAEEARDLYAGLPAPGARAFLLRANQETLGRVFALAGRRDEAVAAARQAVEIGRQAAAETPAERLELASCLESLADRLTEVGRESDAESARTEAAQLRAPEAS